MNNFLLLFINFFKAGLFSIGGGLATLPFLVEISEEHPEWFSLDELANMIAVSESTPGPIGVNAATYVGYNVEGVLGGIVATLSLVLPSFIVVTIVSKFWEKYRSDKRVEKVFTALRATAIGLILSAGAGVFVSAIFADFGSLSLSNFSGIFTSIKFEALALFVVLMIAMQYKKTKKLHPIVFILIAAIFGMVFSL